MRGGDMRKTTYSACRTITLSKKATSTPSVKASMSVNVDRRTRLRGWLWRFQYKRPRLMRVPKSGT